MTRKGHFFADQRVTPTGLHGPFTSKRDAWEWWENKGRRLGVLPALVTADYPFQSASRQILAR